MEESYTRKEFWDSAGRAGLVLGAVPILYMVCEQLLLQDAASKIGAIPASLLTFVLWLAKFAGCILLMRTYMGRFAQAHPGVRRRDVRRQGNAIALTSALVYSAFVLAWTQFVDPEMFTRAMDTMQAQYGSILDSNSMEAMEKMKGSMNQIAFFSQLIYCYLFGVILSAILAPGIVGPDDPFTQND